MAQALRVLPFVPERSVAVQSAITQVLAEARRFADAVPQLIEAICLHAGWPVGALWIPDPSGQRLQPAGWWCNPTEDIPGVDQFFEGWSFTRGEGLLGRIWEEKTPAWLRNAPDDPNFPRTATAIRLGLKGAFAFPIMLRDEFLGAMEFFSLERRKPDAELLQLMRTVGQQIGVAIERWRAETALEESEERYRIVGETAADAIFTIDRNDVIQYANPAIERIFGYKPSELLGKELIEIIPERFRARHLDGIRHFVETDQRRMPWTGVSLPGLHRDGHEIPLEISFGVYRKGDQFLFTGVARDVSDRAKAEEERARLLESERAARVEATQANRAKDEFLATLSHELRSPLTSILGWASILAGGDNDEETIATAIESIGRSARAQSQLIEDVLDVSRIVTGKLSIDQAPVKLLSVVQSVLDMVRPAVEKKGLRLEAHLSPVRPAIGDPARIEQIIWNVLGNAVKFTPPGGRIDVTLQQGSDEWGEILVSDSGEGIAPEFLPQIFERFRQADSTTTRSHGGLGLGLGIARHLVELHGGTVEAQSAGVGKGATFIIRLPLRQVPFTVAPPPPAASFAPNARLDGVSVLVVEDREEASRFIALVLRRAGAAVTTATSSAEALAQLQRKRADILVSDIAMPGEDGHALIRKIRESEKGSGRHLLALALTASAGSGSREQALAAGFDDFRRKPIEPRELAAAVAALARSPSTRRD